MDSIIEIDENFVRELNRIPDRLAFKIGEVAEIVGEKPYVLRYWETEFSGLKPQKSRNNQRVYLKRDVEFIMLIKKLLHQDRFSIEGAKAILQKAKKKQRKLSLSMMSK